MKTSKWLIVILVAALLAVYYFIGSDYFKQRRNNESLTSQISGAQTALAQVPSPPTDLEQRLAAARNDLQTAENSFSADMNDTRIVKAVLQTADEIGVKAVPLNTSPWVTEQVSDRNYAVFRLNLEVTGTFRQLLSFIYRLESGEPETLVIEYLSVKSILDSSGGSSDNGTVQVNTNIKLAVYALPPATG